MRWTAWHRPWALGHPGSLANAPPAAQGASWSPAARQFSLECFLLLKQDGNLLGQTQEASPLLSPKLPETRRAPGLLRTHRGHPGADPRQLWSGQGQHP